MAELNRQQQQALALAEAEAEAQAGNTSTGLVYEDQNPEESTNEDFLRNDPEWVAASKIMWEAEHGVEFEGTDREAADYGINTMGWFNSNLPSMSVQASRLANASEKQKEAFLYLMDGYDDLGLSWEGAGRFVKGVVTDPTTYVGIASLGIGTAVGQGAKVASKEGLKQILKQGIRVGTVGSIDGAIYTSSANSIRQGAEVAAGRREEFSFGEAAASGAFGAAAGGVTGGVLGSGGAAIGQRLSRRAQRRAAQRSTQAGGRTSGRVAQADNVPATDEAPVAPQTPTDGTQGATQGPATRSATGEATEEAAEEVGEATTAGSEEAQNVLENLGQIRATLEDPTIQGSAFTEGGGPQSIQQVREYTQPIADLIEKAAENNEYLSVYLTRFDATASQLQLLKNATQQATDSVKLKIAELNKRVQEGESATIVTSLRDQVDELETTLGTLERADLELSAQTGRDLVQRRAGVNTGELRGVTVNSLITEEGYTRAEAEVQYNTLIEQRQRYLNRSSDLAELNRKITEAARAGNYSEAIKLKHQRKTLLGKVDTQRTEDGSAVGKLTRKFNRAMEGIAEIMISNVFSTSTLIVNIVPSYVKSLYKPALNFLMKDPTSREGVSEMVSNYTAMNSTFPAALKAGIAAFRYERSLLLDDANRMLEERTIIPKKFGGGVLRFFPRMLGATDEFFSQMAYRGYASGRLAAQAIEDGTSKGLKGRALQKHVKDHVSRNIDQYYSSDVGSDEKVINMLLDQAMDRGLSGGKADAWVRNELNKNEEVFRRAMNDAGKDYTKDLLFKREFSGTNLPSKLAKGYEKFVKAHPFMRVAGQLFFRTPVRVFEEGVRLTPGLNMISPNFMRDLAGKNGTMRQVRAQGEAMMSYGIAGQILSLYANGNITGAGPTDYRQRRQGENTEDFEPYTITMPNGDKWSYRRLDPLSTPLKIIVNGLERYETLKYRQSQGERVNENDLQKSLAYVKVGTGAIAQAFRDASLTQGIDQIMSGVELAVSENDTSGQLIKYLGQKLNTFVPNTWYKVQQMKNPVLNDPAQLDQFLKSRINPDDPKVPKMYTALGRPRTLSNPESNLVMFNPSTPQERRRGIPDKELEVENALWTMTQVGDVYFTAPYKHRLTGEVDLRTRMTNDGEESLYDRWMRYTHESGVVDALHAVAVESDLPYGTPSDKGARITQTRNVLNKFRDAAMIRLMAEESGLTEEYIREQHRSAVSESGGRDNLNTLF